MTPLHESVAVDTNLAGPPPCSMSLIIPTYKREQVLVETLDLLAPLLQPGDEILVIDQTPVHEPATEEGLRRLVAAGAICWYRRAKPHICEAMNAGARLARGDHLLFLDDDVVPDGNLLEAHRDALSHPDAPPAVCGQVLQPWHKGPIPAVRDFALGFDAAYDKPCQILSLMAGNFSMRRDTFVGVGGFDESFSGPCYRLEAELSYRIYRLLGRKVAFDPGASIRHLKADGGTRAFGEKDTWAHIGGSIGDYYFALRCLPFLACLRHTLTRFIRAPLNRNTVENPWLIPSLFLRETVAWFRAVGRVWTRPNNYIKDADYYGATSPLDPVAV
jgi:GT2 family glycosyltransferase